MVEPPSAMYVQSCGSVRDMGALASGGGLRTGRTAIDDWLCDSSGLTRPGLWDAFSRERLRKRRKENMGLRKGRSMAATGGDAS